MKTEELKGTELIDPDIVNLANKKRVLMIPDFNKQMGRLNESAEKNRRIRGSDDDSKTIDKKIEFHKYLTKKYGTKTSFL